jgi:hypothetical protein
LNILLIELITKTVVFLLVFFKLKCLSKNLTIDFFKRCFDRSKKKHSINCPHQRKYISQSFDSPFDKPPFDSTSLYADTFKKFNYEKYDPEIHGDDVHGNDPDIVLKRNQSLKVRKLLLNIKKQSKKDRKDFLLFF